MKHTLKIAFDRATESVVCSNAGECAIDSATRGGIGLAGQYTKARRRVFGDRDPLDSWILARNVGRLCNCGIIPVDDRQQAHACGPSKHDNHSYPGWWTVTDRLVEAADLSTDNEFLLWCFRAIDGFWYLALEQAQGPEAANRFNEEIWDRLSHVMGKEIVKRFRITETGLEGFEKALRLFPWFRRTECELFTESNAKVLVVTQCPQQAARVKRGLPEYHCKEMHMRAFKSFAQAIDPSLRVECRHAPPDPIPMTDSVRGASRRGNMPTDVRSREFAVVTDEQGETEHS